MDKEKRRLLHQGTEEGHVLHIFFHLFAFGRFEDFRDFLEPRGLHDEAEGLQADLAPADVLVSVDARVEGCLGIVEVKGGETIAPNEFVEPGEYSFDAGESGDVVTAGKEVGGVEADAEAFGALYVIKDEGKFLKGAAQGGTLAGGDLQGDAHGILWRLGEELVEAGDDLPEAGFDAGSHVGAGMENEEGKAQLFCADQLFAKAAHGTDVKVGVRGREVDQIACMAKDGRQFPAPGMAAEGVGLRGGQGGGKPLHIIFHEDLHGRAADGKGAFDGQGTAAGGRNVGAEERIEGFWHKTGKRILRE